MVLKAKSENTIQPLRNVTKFSSWVLPSFEVGDKPGFRQPLEDVPEEPELTAEELAKIQNEELKKTKEAAYQEGFNSGQKAGLAAAKHEIEQQKKSLVDLINNLSDPIKECKEKTQQELVQLAFAIARQIVRRELKQDPTQLIAIIREALKLLPIGAQKIEIALHPEDALMIKNTLSIDTGADSSRWKVNSDPAIERGSCLVSTKNSKIDISIDKQIAILFNRMVGGLRAGETDNKMSFDNDLNVNAQVGGGESSCPSNSIATAEPHNTEPNKAQPKNVEPDIDAESGQYEQSLDDDINDE